MKVHDDAIKACFLVILVHEAHPDLASRRISHLSYCLDPLTPPLSLQSKLTTRTDEQILYDLRLFHPHHFNTAGAHV